MIQFGGQTEDGRKLLFVGLTDVNMHRLFSHDDPFRFKVAAVDEVIIFHATRQSLVDLARKVGADEKVFLDQLGEG